MPELTRRVRRQARRDSRTRRRAGQSVAELERSATTASWRCCRRCGHSGAGAGETLAAWERGLLASAPSALDGGRPRAPLGAVRARGPQPETGSTTTATSPRAATCELLGDATDALLRYIGVDADYLDGGGSYYTVETHICHLRQLFAGDRVEAITQVLGWDDRRLHLFHSIVRRGEDQPVATGEHMLLHVDAGAGRASPVRDGVRDRLARVAEAHAALPPPPRTGRRISL